ncbi:unnamed protein product [Ectocarpus sp. 12 AP-2014]
MLNRVIIDGTGMANTANQSKNLSCRGLMEICKKVVQHVNRSQGFKVKRLSICRVAQLCLYCFRVMTQG